MKKAFKLYLVIWLVGVVLFNVISFVVPAEIGGVNRLEQSSFWVGYALSMIAFAGQLICTFVFFKEENKDKVFFKVPLISTGYTLLIVSVVVSAVFMFIPVIPAWVTAIVCLVMLAIYVVACFKANAVGEVVGDFEEKVKQETNFADYSIAVSSNLCKKATSTEVSDSVKKVYDALRYSPRRSHTQLAELEESILDHLQALDVAVSTNDVVAVQEETTQLLVMIDERNSKSKLYK